MVCILTAKTVYTLSISMSYILYIFMNSNVISGFYLAEIKPVLPAKLIIHLIITFYYISFRFSSARKDSKNSFYYYFSVDHIKMQI